MHSYNILQIIILNYKTNLLCHLKYKAEDNCVTDSYTYF